jgi:hypothetical protein
MRITRNLKVLGLVAAMGLGLGGHSAHAALSDAEMAQLGIEGTPLTPFGAIRAGNKEGTIPAWSPKPLAPPAGYKPGDFPDPFANEKPLFTITAKNYTQYQDKLTPGQIAMFKQYPDTFRMHVYPTHRTGVVPTWMYEATLRQAKNVKLCPEQVTKGEVCIKDYVKGGGVPFPIPKNGDEAGWSAILSPQFVAEDVYVNGALIDTLGNRTDVISRERGMWPWWFKEKDYPKQEVFNAFGGAVLCDSQEVMQPPRSAGLLFGGCNYINNFDFQVYLYLPGQRRVRKAPEIGAHDSPSFASDGQRTVESRWMVSYTGGKDSYHDRKLLDRKEYFLPYNNFKLTQDSAGFDQIFGKKHINQDLIRYELRRAWVIDAVKKPNVRDLYKRMVTYIDEDTWSGLAFEAYDNSDRLWRMGEQYLVYLFEPKTTVIYGDTQIDLINGRYTTYPYWYNQTAKALGKSPSVNKFISDSSVPLPFNTEIYTPQGLRSMGTR